MRRFRHICLITLFLGFPASLFSTSVVRADAFTITTCDETTLRAQVLNAHNAPNASTVTFACDGMITLTAAGGGPILITTDVTINGNGHSVTISGGNAVALFDVSNIGARLTLNALTLANGHRSGYGASGGAINASGSGVSLTITNSTFTGNIADSSGGAISCSCGPMTITNSTFANNGSTNPGGAIFSSAMGGMVTITNSTFSGNSANLGGGIMNFGGIPAVNLFNTIVANSTGGDLGNFFGGTGFTGNNNLIDDTSTITGTGNITNQPAGLASLANNGGPTKTAALMRGSPAIDAGDDATCNQTTGTAPVNKLDQRGITRPQGAHCDIGAFEAQIPNALPLPKAAGPNGGGPNPLPAPPKPSGPNLGLPNALPQRRS